MLASLTQGLAARLPAQCRICHAWPSEIICQNCLFAFAQPRPRCQSCALLVPRGTSVCGACLLRPGPFRECRAAISYGFPWAQLIQNFKFESEPALARSLGQLMLAHPDIRRMVDRASALVPIPLSPARLRERGYNQAARLCRALSPSKTQKDWLSRSGDVAAQHTLKRRDRLRGVQHVFAAGRLSPTAAGQGTIVLVDDVMTTGATLTAAAMALLEAGASEVSALVLARTEAPTAS